jgi:hypothetical protein
MIIFMELIKNRMDNKSVDGIIGCMLGTIGGCLHYMLMHLQSNPFLTAVGSAACGWVTTKILSVIWYKIFPKKQKSKT